MAETYKYLTEKGSESFWYDAFDDYTPDTPFFQGGVDHPQYYQEEFGQAPEMAYYGNYDPFTVVGGRTSDEMFDIAAQQYGDKAYEQAAETSFLDDARSGFSEAAAKARAALGISGKLAGVFKDITSARQKAGQRGAGNQGLPQRRASTPTARLGSAERTEMAKRTQAAEQKIAALMSQSNRAKQASLIARQMVNQGRTPVTQNDLAEMISGETRPKGTKTQLQSAFRQLRLAKATGIG